MPRVSPYGLLVALLLVATLGHAAKLRSPGIEPQALNTRLAAADPPLVIDVRSPSEYSSGHVPGAVNPKFLGHFQADLARSLLI